MVYGYSYTTLTPFLCMLLLAIFISQTPVSYAAAAAEAPSNWVLFRFKFKVHILNGFSDNTIPLHIHCWSEDDDLGKHTLMKDEEFKFKFVQDPVFGTHFYCDFRAGSKEMSYVSVFATLVETKSCRQTGNCFWRLQPDGLYFSDHLGDWEKRHDWQ